MEYVGKIYEKGDWWAKAISELETVDGLLITFLRYSSHHKKWSIENLYEKTFLENNNTEVNDFPDEKPENICICDWID